MRTEKENQDIIASIPNTPHHLLPFLIFACAVVPSGYPHGANPATQQTLDLPDAEQPTLAKNKKTKPAKLPWPDTLAEQAKALRTALASQPKPATPDQLAKTFARANLDRVEELLETLVSLGQARQTTNGTYTS